MTEINVNGQTVSTKRRSITDRIKKAGREADLEWEQQEHDRIRVTLPRPMRGRLLWPKGLPTTVCFFSYDEPELTSWLELFHARSKTL